jgi:hypothetical protein
MDGNTSDALVFIPTLAKLLADAEVTKGSRLTESEVVSITDAAYCVRMPTAKAIEIAELRVYHDVEPENCWADWHRLRVSMTGNGRLPRIILCVPGGADLITSARPILEADGIEHEWCGHDENMVRAFEACARGFDPLLDEKDFAKIPGHAGCSTC